MLDHSVTIKTYVRGKNLNTFQWQQSKYISLSTIKIYFSVYNQNIFHCQQSKYILVSTIKIYFSVNNQNIFQWLYFSINNQNVFLWQQSKYISVEQSKYISVSTIKIYFSDTYNQNIFHCQPEKLYIQKCALRRTDWLKLANLA